MPILIAVVAALLALIALPAEAQQVKIETTRKPSEREARVVTPPLHYETTRAPDGDVYPHGTRAISAVGFAEQLPELYHKTKHISHPPHVAQQMTSRVTVRDAHAWFG